MEWELGDDPRIFSIAVELSIRLDQHLFDTLYHALALHLEAQLVTGDERYLLKARGLGCIVGLDELELPS